MVDLVKAADVKITDLEKAYKTLLKSFLKAADSKQTNNHRSTNKTNTNLYELCGGGFMLESFWMICF